MKLMQYLKKRDGFNIHFRSCMGHLITKEFFAIKLNGQYYDRSILKE